MGRRIVILLGQPGSGKGTQARELEQYLEIPHISTGDILRDHISRGTPYGLAAKEVTHGGYVSDEIANAIVAERIGKPDCLKGFILDGYPRTVSQAETFEREVKSDDFRAVIEIGAEEESIILRLSGRLMCQHCKRIYNIASRAPKNVGICDDCKEPLSPRADDIQEVVRRRFREYEWKTLPLVEYYRGKKCYHHVNGLRPIGKVTEAIIGIVDEDTELPL